MPTAQALRLCPQVVLVSGHRDRYTEMSRQVMAILGAYTPLVEPISIDEAFLDVSGTEAHYGPPSQLAQTLQDRIERELRLSASLGVAANKLVAKIASDYRKPHGITVVSPGEEAAFPGAAAHPPAVGRRRGHGARDGEAGCRDDRRSCGSFG